MTITTMVKIVVLDDHSLFRMGLIAILEQVKDFEVTGEHKSFTSLKPLIPGLNADVVLVDISLGSESGLDIARYIKNVNDRLRVIILSSHKEEFYVVNALEAGIDGYIHKDAQPEELISGIRRVVLDNEKYYSAEISHLLINNIYNRTHKGLPFLTNKEKIVVNYLMEGLSSKEIADKLDVSPRTVDTHRGNVLNKFGLKNTAELITKIAEQKIRF